MTRRFPLLFVALFVLPAFQTAPLRAQEKPTLYEVKDGAPNLINFDLRDGVYIAPMVIDKGYLVIGKHRLDFERN